MENLEAATAAEDTAATAEAAAPAEKKPGIGDVAMELIRSGLGNKEVLEGIKEAFPDAKTTMSSVNWYRNHLRGLGEDVKTARELSAAGKPTDEDKKAAKAAAKAEAKAAKDAEKAAAKQAKADEKAAAKQAKADEKAAAKQAKTDASDEPAEGSFLE